MKPKLMPLLSITLLCTLLLGNKAIAQDPMRLESQVNKLISKVHSLNPNKELIVFTGSSSIRGWKTLESDFPKYNIINHGFGGSQFSDLAFYYDVLVQKPAPDILFIYEGDNDIASGKDPQLVFLKAKDLLEKVHHDLPQTKVAIISPKPCIANWDKRENYIKLNSKLENYSSANNDVDFINVWDLMVDTNGIVFQDIFVEDGDHMNSKGYQIWIEAVGNYLAR